MSRLFTIFLLLFMTTSLALSSENKFHIVIDPGHGGQDLGAIRDSFIEAKIVLEIAKKIKTQLDQIKDIKTTLTRNSSNGIALKDRVQMANDLKADLYISLHANTSNSTSIAGMEFYFNSTQPKPLTTDDSMIIEKPFVTKKDVIEKIKSDFEFYNKTSKSLQLTKSFKRNSTEKNQKSIIKRASYYVIDHTNMPSALIELGFISNRREAKKLVSEEYQNEMAQMLTMAIIEYKEKSDKHESL